MSEIPLPVIDFNTEFKTTFSINGAEYSTRQYVSQVVMLSENKKPSDYLKEGAAKILSELPDILAIGGTTGNVQFQTETQTAQMRDGLTFTSYYGPGSGFVTPAPAYGTPEWARELSVKAKNAPANCVLSRKEAIMIEAFNCIAAGANQGRRFVEINGNNLLDRLTTCPELRAKRGDYSYIDAAVNLVDKQLEKAGFSVKCKSVDSYVVSITVYF